MRPGAEADPASVSDWTKTSFPQTVGEPQEPLDPSLQQPKPPDEHAADLKRTDQKSYSDKFETKREEKLL